MRLLCLWIITHLLIFNDSLVVYLHSSNFVTTQQNKCKHFSVFTAPKFAFVLTKSYLFVVPP